MAVLCGLVVWCLVGFWGSGEEGWRRRGRFWFVGLGRFRGVDCIWDVEIGAVGGGFLARG